MRWWPWALLVLITAVVSSTLSRAQESEVIVREIEVRFVGPETVNRAVVMANIQTAVGKPRVREVIEQDVRNLINTGYFFDVRVLEESVADGVKVVFQVQGKATLKEVLFEGNKRYKEERLRRESDQKAGDILDERKAHADARKMEELYQKGGYPDVKVVYEVSLDKDTGKAVLKFKVDEGQRIYIKQIKFSGNKAFPAKRLSKLLKTRRHWWGSWLSSTGVLKQEDFKEDLDKLRDHYHTNGYIDMEIRSTRVDRQGTKWMIVLIDIYEGTQYKVGNVRIEGNSLFPTPDLEKRLKMAGGKTFTPGGMAADQKAIEDFYGSRGYLDTTVRPTRVPNVETGRIDMTYSIREGDLTYIEKIEIRGNTKTKDKVIRRELAVNPGEIYDTVRVERSVERIKNLGYFVPTKVEATPEPTDVPNRKDLVLSVEEQRTGSVTFGAGFSSIDSLIGFVEVTQGNFDLFNWPSFTGAGQKLRLRMQLGFERQDYELSFTEPWFLDKKLSLGFDLFHHESSFLSSDFTEQRTGGDLRLERALSEFVRASVQYSIQSINLTVDRAASQEMQSQDGSRLRSAILGALTYDTRDSVFLTTRGNKSEVSAEFVGIGGDVQLYKLNVKTTFYFPFFESQVLQLLGAAGVVEAFGATKGDGKSVTETIVSGGVTSTVVRTVNDVPIFDRYFLGGANTLRGFSYRKVGPKDADGEPIGGNAFYNATAEYTFPIIERVRGAVFFDIGTVETDAYSFSLGNLKSDAGVGVRLNLPIGPLRLDYGYPIMTDKQTGRTGKIQFSVGYQF